MAKADRSAIRYLDDRAQDLLAGGVSVQPAAMFWDNAESTIREISRCVVALSSDYYWESDHEHRITQVSFSDEARGRQASEFLVGKTRWETGVIPVSSTWEAHRECLDAREPFRNFLMRRSDPNGDVSYISASGMPRFDRNGAFTGYLGISKDVTTDVQLNIISDLEVAVMQLLSGVEFADAVSAAMKLICKKLGFRWGRFREARRDHAELRTVCSTRKNEPATSLRIDCPEAGEASEGSVPLAVRAFRDHKTIIATVRRPGAAGQPTRLGVAIPLKSRRGPFGVLEFCADRIDYPRSRFARFLAHVAAQIGIAYERHQAAEGLRESEDRFASTFELAAIGICHIAPSGRLVHVNRRMSEILGYSREELLARTVSDISHPDDRGNADEQIARLARREIDHFELEKRYLRKDGESVWVRIKTVMKWSDTGEPLYHISVVEDISARRKAEEQVEFMATHDELTGLPNRALFNELLGQAIAARKRDRQGFCAVLFVDLDRFKNINDSLGHHAGDELLRLVTGRIRRSIRANDRVARFGGDEFVVLVDNVERPRDAELVARKIIDALAEPVQLQNQECRVTASIGIAICPDDGEDAQSLIQKADVAMYSAKQNGRNELERYSVDLTPTVIDKIRLEGQLQRALERREFRILYQPRVDAVSGRVVGAEALLRWWNAELGTIPPVQFIPAAEETGLIIPIGRWLLQSACQQHRAWCKRGLRPIVISVNLSPKQFTDPELLTTVKTCLDEFEMEPGCLELEITEGMLMTNLEQAIETARDFRKLGVRLAIDDFGTGYSSLMQLKRFPFHTLKIDRSFVRDLPENKEDRAITEAIVAMGKTLGVTVVAEGIETEAQHAMLKDIECDELQGFLFGAPCHPDEVALALRN